MNHVSGIYAALLTPFHEDQSIHKEALQQLVARMIDNGVHGLFALGTNGEFHTLTPQEKYEVATIVLKEAKGKIPVMLGVGGNYTEEAIQLAKGFEQLGATMFLCHQTKANWRITLKTLLTRPKYRFSYTTFPQKQEFVLIR
ncbi:hypothetical protein J26TS2_30960 [Shouchella clausii]|nr:hypothetical protein J26TS2_30960 [Shouchella clausii]